MPHRDGLELLEHVKATDSLKYIPVIMLTGNTDFTVKKKALDLGATDFLQKPCDSVELVVRLQNVLALKNFHDEIRAQNETLDALVRKRTLELEQSRRSIIHCLAKAAEQRDVETGNHITRVALYSQILAEELGYDEAFQETIMLASPLHDVGKIGISDDILRKPGSLSEEERAEMKRHCEIGASILQAELAPTFTSMSQIRFDRGKTNVSNELLGTAAKIAIAHHEWFDGSGYPYGIQGEDIPIEARIVAVCDVYDALRSARPYKSARTCEDTMSIIQAASGTQFDPDAIEALKRCYHRFETVLEEFSDWTQESTRDAA